MSILTIFLGIFLTYPGIIPILYPGLYAKKSGLDINVLLENYKGASVIKDVLAGGYQASLVTLINYFFLESPNLLYTLFISFLAAMVLFKHIQYAK